jgi:RNA polymerase sigma-70 factor (ECF subfamily)
MLPEPYSQALILTEYEGLSQKEMAERLGISFSGAKSRVQRARRKLRDLLLQCCHFELDRRAFLDYYPYCRGCNPSLKYCFNCANSILHNLPKKLPFLYRRLSR